MNDVKALSFTLIELLIVVSIIGILAAMGRDSQKSIQKRNTYWLQQAPMGGVIIYIYFHSH